MGGVFDDVSRGLRRLERGMTISVSLPSDAEGYDEKECPNPDCLAQFKVHTDDWTNLVADEVVYCPICRYPANSQSWFTQEQIDYAQTVARERMIGEIDRVFAQGSRRASRRAPRDGLIVLSFSYKPSPRRYVAPLEASDVLVQRSTCEACTCRYASVGAAFFCPACGHNSARSTFSDTLATVRASLELLPRLRELVDADAAADLRRNIIENGLVKLVAAFQRYAEATYDALPGPKAAPGFNAFQRLADGSTLFAGAGRPSYESILGATKLAELGRYFQQRHVLSHEDGLVDQQYIDRSGDTSYRIGQRLIVKADSVRHAADLIDELAKGLD
jgi:hypothetical protein